MEEETLISFNLISLSGESRSYAFEALEDAMNGDFDESTKKMNIADEKSNEAHKVQFQLLSQESSGKKIQFSILMVHAQDHLMTSMLAIDLIKNQIELIKRLK